MLGDERMRLGCWSCSHNEFDRCGLGRAYEWDEDKGEDCLDFDYEPGSDEAERNEDD